MGVPPSGTPSLCCDHPLSRLDEVGDDFARILVIDYSAAGHGDDEVLSGEPRFEAPFSRPSVLRLKLFLVFEVGKGEGARSSLEDDIPSPAAVGTVRAALGNEFFPAEAEASVSASSPDDLYGNKIDKLHSLTRFCSVFRKKGKNQGPYESPGEKAFRIFTLRPLPG